MKPLFTQEEFDSAKANDKLPCKCYNCSETFFKQKKLIQTNVKYNRGRIRFCSFDCSREYIRKKENVNCLNCGNIHEKRKIDIEKSKTGNFFCSRSCAAIYNNAHKTKGNRRSKLEKYLEIELIKLYPNLEILFNDNKAINSELDIYIPLLKLAFELNGTFHYEPIFGQDKLIRIQNNDNRKFQACIEHGIELCIIDTSQQIYFKFSTSQKYFEIIKFLVDEKLSCNDHHMQVI
jgi:hypothetical protein